MAAECEYIEPPTTARPALPFCETHGHIVGKEGGFNVIGSPFDRNRPDEIIGNSIGSCVGR
jgi:hypothetical protein